MKDFKTYKEFGFILMYDLPRAYSLYKQGKLGKTISRLGTQSLFYFSQDHEENNIHDEVVFSEQYNCYSFNKPKFTYDDWSPPNLNEYYKNDEIVFDKPILTIHNKNNIEWSVGLFNYFPKEVLRILFEKLSDKFQIIYIRPFYENDNITRDSSQSLVDIGDDAILKEYPDVIWIKDLYSDKYDSYNELQFKILANSEHHIAPAGDCVIPAYFGGDLVIYSHPKCNSTNRGIWKSDSWLKEFSGANIQSYDDYNNLIGSVDRWT
jgi:hypothetical protein